MAISKCFVPGCRTGYSSDRRKMKAEGKKVHHLFRAKNQEQLEKWKKKVPRSDKELSLEDCVCALHFLPEDIDNFFTYKSADGSICKHERKKALLKDGAVPSIFPALPSYLSVIPRRRKCPFNRNTVCPVPKKSRTVPTIWLQTFDELKKNITDIQKPNDMWGITQHPDFLMCTRWNTSFQLEKKVVIQKDLNIRVFLKDMEVQQTQSKLNAIDDLSTLLLHVENYGLCSGAVNSTKDCLVFLQNPHRVQKSFCKNCRKAKRKAYDAKRYRLQFSKTKNKVWKQQLSNIKKRNSRLKQKVVILRRSIELTKDKCAKAKKSAVKEAIVKLPESQQEAVYACIKAATIKNPKGFRYTVQWIYKCILMRIKSHKLYDHLRFHKILALPSPVTLGKYLQKVKSIYGFNSSIFKCLKEKAVHMSPSEKRGVLLVDEMKISPRVCFDPNLLKIHGFTDLGKYTPELQKNQKGDHALVLMFQPFRGKWVQAIACFLSKGAASGSVLHPHVCDPKRKLWFISDFPHLIKNLRNFITNKKVVQTPDGIIKLQHWETLLAIDNPTDFSLKICPNLKPQHVNPKYYQKMNVSMAFQFFSNSVGSAMQLFKDQHPNLNDCIPTIKLVENVNNLIDAMNSRTPKTAMKINSPAYKAIADFLQFFTDWERFAAEAQCPFVPSNTALGLKISLRATLEIAEFLTNTCDFQYLMTARLNQDALERFFGMMRNACGSNDHPDSLVFMQVFKLLGTYSLIKPPKGSNVTGADLLNTLMKPSDVLTSESMADKESYLAKLDEIISKGHLEGIPILLKNMSVSQANSYHPLDDHSYSLSDQSEFAISYFAGYIARKSRRFTTCPSCLNFLTSSDFDGKNKLIQLKSKGHLLAPSESLFGLILLLENTAMRVIRSSPLSVGTFSKILEEFERNSNINFVGCDLHQLCLTRTVVNFYLITRMHFFCTRENLNDNRIKELSRECRKKSKLT